MYNRESKIKEIMNNPFGKDIILQIERELPNWIRWVLGLSFLRGIKLKTLVKFCGKRKKEFEELIEIICEKMNESRRDSETPKRKSRGAVWWSERVFYQIYPRSFRDSNGDGIGDIAGIIEKIDYLDELGIGGIWLSPIYDSPNDDNGYDIRDYRKVSSEFGNLQDLERLIDECHKRDIKIIMDLVLNHTSDEHEWFQRALKGDSEYRQFYIFKKGKNGRVPNDWKSFFSGSAWEAVDEGEFYLHLFSKKQPDLNWENESMREELYDMVRWWIEKGIDGFRLDVINFISKDKRYRDGNSIIGDITGFKGIENYLNGPRIHEFLRELYNEGFKGDDVFTVGECNGLGLQTAKDFIRGDRNELSTVFSFRHMHMPGKTKWDKYEYDIRYLVRELIDIQGNTDDQCLYALFTDNHDSPRLLSRIKNKEFSDAQGKLINVLLLTLKGIPFIYQGGEIGMKNGIFESLADLKDIESINKARELRVKGMKEEKIRDIIFNGTRDNARVPFIWTETKMKRESGVEPWLKCKSTGKGSSVQEQERNGESFLNHSKRVIRIRKDSKALSRGDFNVIELSKKHFIYERISEDERFIVVMNLSKKRIKCKYSDVKCIYSNYNINSEELPEKLRPYECRIIDTKKS